MISIFPMSGIPRVIHGGRMTQYLYIVTMKRTGQSLSVAAIMSTSLALAAAKNIILTD